MVTYGHPTPEIANGGDEIAETTTAKHGWGIRGWLTDKKSHEHGKDVLAWMKNKFGLKKTSTTQSPPSSPSPPPPPTTGTNEPDFAYEVTDPAIDTGNGNGIVVVPEPYDGNGEVPSEGNERPETPEESATDGESFENNENPYPITEEPTEFADPSIDLRSTSF